MRNIEYYINSSDPLSKEAFDFLISYNEEDDHIDFKETIDLKSEKEWLSLTKDISAFANTFGGYLVFGIEDKDKNIIGLSQLVSDTLKDSNQIQEKINRNLEPNILSIRSKSFNINNKTIVVVFIPRSINVTHMVKKDGIIRYPNNNTKIILHKGTFYIRRSGGNHLGDSRDLDDLIERRIDQFRESLMGKVAKVVNSPTESNVFILSKDPDDSSGSKFIIDDSPDSIPIKGLSFTVTPKTNEEEIAAWTAFSNDDSIIKPPPEIVWKWYSLREEIKLNQAHKLSLFQFSLWDSTPCFYWIAEIENTSIRDKLYNAIKNRPSNAQVAPFLRVAGFLGKGAYSKSLHYLGNYVEKIPQRLKKFPTADPMEYFCKIKLKRKQKPEVLRKELISEINLIADSVVKSKKIPGAYERDRALDIDCYLYAQNDKYK